jgi:hypothetical protein
VAVVVGEAEAAVAMIAAIAESTAMKHVAIMNAAAVKTAAAESWKPPPPPWKPPPWKPPPPPRTCVIKPSEAYFADGAALGVISDISLRRFTRRGRQHQHGGSRKAEAADEAGHRICNPHRA